jgi:DNA modification methylase
MQLELVRVAEPAQPPGIDLRCCSVEALLNDMPGKPALIIADPPWSYSQSPGVAAPDLQYKTMTDRMIADLLDRAYDVCTDARLALWCTWPKLGEWWNAAAASGIKWRYVSGGSWHKKPGGGVGYHWLGNSEIALLYVKGSPGIEWGSLSNAHESPRQKHSEKPADWMSQWLERWTEPGDLVCELFAGMAPVARACLATGRQYVGAEIDPERYRNAVDRIALFNGAL